jgi:hypothetical protein
MTPREALNVAWHVRVNGLDDNVTPELIKSAFAAFEVELKRLRDECDIRAEEHLAACKVVDQRDAKIAALETRMARVEALSRAWALRPEMNEAYDEIGVALQDD